MSIRRQDQLLHMQHFMPLDTCNMQGNLKSMDTYISWSITQSTLFVAS